MRINLSHNNTLINYKTAYDCCATVIEENRINYPLDVFSLIESYGIKILSYTDFCLKQNISFKEVVDSFSAFGFLCRDKNSSKAIIYYNDHNSLETNNFTLLHELGHYLMNHFEDNRDNDNLANCFARNLIAPASVCQKLKFEDPYSLSEYFQISLSAAHTRLDFIQRDLYHINQLGKHPMFYYKPLLYAQ